MVCPIKLKTDMLYHMNSTFRDTVFQIPVDVPLNTVTICLRFHLISVSDMI